MCQYHADYPCKHFLVKILGNLNAVERFSDKKQYTKMDHYVLSEQRPRVLFFVCHCSILFGCTVTPTMYNYIIGHHRFQKVLYSNERMSTNSCILGKSVV